MNITLYYSLMICAILSVAGSAFMLVVTLNPWFLLPMILGILSGELLRWYL